MKLKLEEEKSSVVFDLAALFGLYGVFILWGIQYFHNSVKYLQTKVKYEVLELIF